MDQGGTFTDVLTTDEHGRVRLDKVLSAGADLHALAASAQRVSRGTTVATNALLCGTGRPVLLLTTAGFEDAQALGDGRRPDLFSLEVRPRTVLAAHVCGVPGRILASGDVEAEVDLDVVARAVRSAQKDHEIDAVAVVLVHGPRAPDQERRIAAKCRKLGISQVSVGHELAQAEGFVERLATTVVDAALTPLLPRARGRYMRSDGGTAPHDSADWRGCHAVLSGPAGGVVASAALAQDADLGPIFSLDMGGTSTDVAAIVGGVARTEHLELAGLRLRVPAVALHTVAAGGGSVLRVTGGVYAVGPESAGAEPGPAAYGRGGPATVTDCEAVLGRLPGFPEVCGPRRDQPLDLEAARAAIHALDPSRPVEAVAAGFRQVAHATMARAVAGVAASRGLDVRDCALLAFGGAGPAHGCGVARKLGMRRVVVPLLAGGFSAVGVGIAGRRSAETVVVGARVCDALSGLSVPFLGEQCLSLGVRHVGTGPLLDLPVSRADVEILRSPVLQGGLRARFDRLHATELGFTRPGLAVEVVELRCVTVEADAPLPGVQSVRSSTNTRLSPAVVRAWFGGARDVPVFDVADLGATDDLVGPALLKGLGCTVVVDPGWRVTRARGCWVLVDESPLEAVTGADFDPVETSVFGSQIGGIADQMGLQLQRLARSVSIRERLDFSCAVFDAEGQLAANAPHVPVHLGAMGETVRDLLAREPRRLMPGTFWVSNDPYHGGSHLPDITVMAPVFGESGSRIGFVAARGHHVDVGGSRPGSMPADARSIDEEGFVLRNHCLVDNGMLQVPDLPGCRQPAEVTADLEAQVAACATGIAALGTLAAQVGEAVFGAQLGHLRTVARAGVEGVLARLSGGGPRTLRGREVMDDGTEITVRLDVDGLTARVWLGGPAHPGNRNAPTAVGRAALLYVLRCLLDAESPLNEGALGPVELTVEPGGLFDPCWPRAVAGGNVETSQRLVDALLAAVGACAASQGTMNNVTIGFPNGSWYETIAGGAGAGPGFEGGSAVQVHMTNTRATDVEVLERRFPVVLRQHRLRRHSGGGGRHRGGDGVVKEWEFRAPVEISVMAERRAAGAPGADGGEPGLPGREDAFVDGAWVPVDRTVSLGIGGRLRLCTPGGGGWGRAQDPRVR